MDITKRVVAILLACFGTPTHASDACVFAVPGGEPIYQFERGRAHRIVSRPTVVPGFNGFLMRPSHRDKDTPLLHFNGNEIVPIKGDFPHRAGLALTHGITPVIDGMTFGFGSDHGPYSFGGRAITFGAL